MTHVDHIQDMDLYNEHRTMIHSGPIARKDKNEAGLPSWTDYTAVLLDHYCVLFLGLERIGLLT